LPVELCDLKFNTIISTEVIEHLYSPREYLDFCKKILLNSGGGDIIITTPYHGYFKNIFLALTGKLDKHFTVLWDGGHIKFWSKKTVYTILHEKGFKDFQFIGCGRFPFLWKSMLIKASI
jgi:2-polyprenyl-3-methyl-5-hydroxy-6-metoxy-1,4-benzoquinol methylase